MMPPTSIDGTDITGATIDGTDVTEITVDGQTVFEAVSIPASAVLNLNASNYSGSIWTANIGQNVPDNFGNPTKTTATNGGKTFDVVNYAGDSSQNNSIAPPGDIAVIIAFRYTDLNSNYVVIDGGTTNEFVFFNNPSDFVVAFYGATAVTSGNLADTDFHVFAMENRSGGRLLIDGTVVLNFGSVSGSGLSGFTISGNNGGNAPANMDVAEITILSNHTQAERDSEIARLQSEYNI